MNRFSIVVRPPQHLNGVADRRQRVAQLVRQHGQELVLAAVALAQLGVEGRVVEGEGGASCQLLGKTLRLAVEAVAAAAHEHQRAQRLAAGSQRQHQNGGAAELAEEASQPVAPRHRRVERFGEHHRLIEAVAVDPLAEAEAEPNGVPANISRGIREADDADLVEQETVVYGEDDDSR